MIACEFENGSTAHLRHVTVNAVVLRNQGSEVLLGRRGTFEGKKILEHGKWSLIGGFMDRDETLAEAVEREVMEEAGWRIKNLRPFRINDRPDRPAEDRQNVDVIFLADAVERVDGTDEEVAELVWFDIGELPDASEVAFDHYESLELYRRYQVERFSLPLDWRGRSWCQT